MSPDRGTVDLSSERGEITLAGGRAFVRWAAAWTAAGRGPVSGDRHLAAVLGERAVLGVVDGLGHGSEAALAAEAAVAAVVSAGAHGGARELIAACHRALTRTRGAVATVAEIDPSGSLSWAGVGNVESMVVPAGGASAIDLAAGPGILGMRAPRMGGGHVRLAGGDVLLMATDGVDVRFRWEMGMRGDVESIAKRAVTGWTSGLDDGLLLAARYVDRGEP
ncbi:MAG TPA: SpoIIE family protein phosphatase [Candidatus Dormibacteraeota bacterium]